MKKLIIFSLFIIAALTACTEKREARVEVGMLRCEGLDNPLGIDFAPRLSWQLFSKERNVVQASYQIMVASSPEKLKPGKADLWDSGVVWSEESTNIRFAGEVKSRSSFYWKVMAGTNKGFASSEVAYWSSGLTQPSDWKAQWTGLDRSYEGDVLVGKTRLSARYFRKEFNVESRKISKATLYVSGLGLYEASINGNYMQGQLMSPTPTDYSRSVKYNTFDVKDYLNEGDNAIGITLGNGRFFSMRNEGAPVPTPYVRNFGFPKMILQLEINYADGTVQTIVSDTSWKATAKGPIRHNSEFDGEVYDARMEMQGWDEAGFDDSAWETAEAVASPGGRLEGQVNMNIASMEHIRPVSIKELKPGVYIMDMGQNMVGRIAMQVSGKRDQEVKLRFSETLNASDGSLYMDNIRDADATDRYILKGNEMEEWEPSFTYHGFRYVEISGYPGEPTLDRFLGNVIYDRMETTGTFVTSNETINQIYRNAYWGIRGNYRGMPTDCPQRDERMGWLGDRAVGSHGESFIFDNNNLYAKWLDDIEQAQRENGSIPDVAPNYWSMYSDNMTWPGAYVIIANMLYEQYGNIDPIVRHYDSMKKWMSYMRDRYMVNGILTKDTYGDWCMPPEKPELIHSEDPARKTEGALLSTTFYYRILTLLERFAILLDKPDDAKALAAEAVMIRDTFNSSYLNAAKGQYSNNTVTANLLPLCYGMVPKDLTAAIFDNIVEKTMGEFNGHVSTGLVGIQWLMRGLTEYGRPDIAYRIATNRTYPSWGYMIEKGATTIWELWNGDTANPAMNSGNHVMLLGDLIVWFYEDLAGIRNHPSSVGFRKIEMKPYPVEGLNSVNASYNSIHGKIESSWHKDGDRFSWDINIPCNTRAVVHIPTADKSVIKESGRDISSISDIKFIGEKDGYAIYETGSGKYSFTR